MDSGRGDGVTKWQPWEDFRLETPFTLPIDGPPCVDCKFWLPMAQFDRLGKFDGVQLCHSPEMEHDFSCFKEREEGIRA